jgi:hypothetical protein
MQWRSPDALGYDAIPPGGFQIHRGFWRASQTERSGCYLIIRTDRERRFTPASLATRRTHSTLPLVTSGTFHLDAKVRPGATNR